MPPLSPAKHSAVAPGLREFVRTNALLIALVAVALLAGACDGGSAATPAASTAAPPATASGFASASAPTSRPSPTATATGPSVSMGPCTPEAPTAASTGWSILQAHDGDFSLKYPGGWDRIYGAFVFTTSTLLDAKTFAETGLPASDQTRADLVRRPGIGLPNASVLIVPGVVSDTATVFARQVDRFRAIPDITIVGSNLVACIGGEQALGIAFTFNGGTTYQESWYIVRNGRSYDFQWLAPKGQEQSDMFREMLRTLQWNPDVPVATPQHTASPRPTTAPSGSAAPAFVLAGMTTKSDTGSAPPDPKDFVTVIPKESTSIHAVFTLRQGLTGQVNGTLTQGDKVLVQLSLQYGPSNARGDFRINSASGIPAGVYTMVMTFVPTGETISLPFTVR
jgi:hypothetical protein